MAMENCCSIHVHAIPYGFVMYSIYGCSEAVTQDQARSSLRRPSVSILEALKTPKASDLTRKRKVDCIPPPKGKSRARGEGSSEPKTVCPRERERISGRVLDCDRDGSSETFLYFSKYSMSVCVTNFAFLY